MIRCPSCGEQLEPGSAQCVSCGEELSEAPRKLIEVTPGQKRLDHVAQMALLWGLLGIVVCQIFGIGGVWKGNEAKRIAQVEGLDMPGVATAGIVLGWISIVLGVLFVLLLLLGVVLLLV